MTKHILTYILSRLAHRAILRYRPIVIGVTGSVGKTFTKEVIARTLSTRYSVRNTEKNFNNELGVPMTILGIRPYLDGIGNKISFIFSIIKSFYIAYSPFPSQFPEVLVLELGADHPGDIAYLASLVMPSIGVVTAIGEIPVHVEFYSSPKALADEKSELIKALKGSHSLAVLNYDDPAVLNMRNDTMGKVITFGFSPDAYIRASGVRYWFKDSQDLHLGISFTLHTADESREVILQNVIGTQQIGAFLAATAVATHLGIAITDVVSSFERISPQPGRMSMIKGIKHSLIIDDTYNSSPIAVKAALTTLGDLGSELITGHKIARKVAILGDMRELGQYTREAHREIGRNASVIAGLLIVVGEYSDYVIEGARAGMDASRIIRFADSIEARNEISKYIEEGDIILVKGSQSARMEHIVKGLMAEPAKAKDLLVRQSDYWLQN